MGRKVVALVFISDCVSVDVGNAHICTTKSVPSLTLDAGVVRIRLSDEQKPADSETDLAVYGSVSVLSTATT